MEPVYIFGHKNPDTDSIVSAMAYAALQNALGENNYIAARLGHLNTESAYLLNKFGFKAPLYITSVRTQISDIEFDRPPNVGSTVPVSLAWQILHGPETEFSAIPVTREDGTLYGMITAGSIAESDMESINRAEIKKVPVFNILSALEGRILNSEEDLFDEISGEVVIALPGNAARSIRKGAVVICGDQQETVEDALKADASCIIICQSNLSEKYIDISSKTCMIATPCDAYRAARMIFQSIPVDRVCQKDKIVHFHLTDYLDDVRDTVLQSRYRAYPVLDDEDKVVGTLSRYHLIRPRKKKVVLVDHNEKSQSVAGLDQAEIIAILDHHRLADVQTGNPVFMRNEPVGSTTSIVASMFQEKGLMPSPALAGLMAAAIISDTVMFKSPTCTPRDKKLAERLARYAGVDTDKLGEAIFARGASANIPVDEMLKSDMKEYHLSSHSLAISQITTVNAEAFLRKKDEIVAGLEAQRKENHYDMTMLMLTNVLKEGTELLFCGDEEIIRIAFGVDEIHDHYVFLPKVMSRKKQIVPALSQLWG